MAETFLGFRNVIRKVFGLGGASEESTEIMISALSDSLIRQYDEALKKWRNSCQEKSIYPFRYSNSNILARLF